MPGQRRPEYVVVSSIEIAQGPKQQVLCPYRDDGNQGVT